MLVCFSLMNIFVLELGRGRMGWDVRERGWGKVA